LKFNNKKVGILVRDIIKIEEKNSNDLRLPSSTDPKISYVTDVNVEDESQEDTELFLGIASEQEVKKELCIVLT